MIYKMAPEFDFEELGVPRIAEGIIALILAPVVLPVAAGVSNPLAQAVIKEGIKLSERVKEASAHTQEVFEDLAAEAKAELAESQVELNSGAARTQVTQGKSNVAVNIMNVMSDLNEQVRQATNGFADLQMLVPLGLSALALKQLLDKGPELEEIPWYTLAWYAFDSFKKFNDMSESQLNSHAETTSQA